MQCPAAFAAAEAEGGVEGLREICAGEDFPRGARGGDPAFAEEERVRDGGDNFLHMVRDEKQGGPASIAPRSVARGGVFPGDFPKGFLCSEALHEAEELLARDGIKTGAGFVEDEHGGLRHESAR